MQNTPDRNGQVNIWEILTFLGRRWHWLAAAGMVGALLGAVVYVMVPSKFEASLVIQPARVGSITGGYANPVVQGIEPEPAALMVERFKLPGFFTPAMRDQCRVPDTAGYQKEMARDLNASLVKLQNPNLSLAKIAWNATSPEIATECITSIFNRIKDIQADIVAPVIKKVSEQKSVTQREVEHYDAQLAKIEKSLPPRSFAQGNFNQLVVADKVVQNLSDSLSEARKRLAEEEAQLLPPYTQPVLMFEPVYASSIPVLPLKLAMIIGVATGLFAGMGILLAKHAIANARSEI